MNVHDFKVKTIDGAEVSLSQYKGLEVLAFPSNDFGGQEPGTNAEIKEFCERRYRTTFPLFAKIPVKGPKADPLYRFLTTLPVDGGEVTWNFDKFLVDPKGTVVAHLDSGVEPNSAEMRKRVEAILPAKQPPRPRVPR